MKPALWFLGPLLAAAVVVLMAADVLQTAMVAR
jgi:predicted outer membrane lipoprotein